MTLMKTSRDYPPNFDAIEAVFHAGTKAIYCYGDTVFIPGGGDLPPWLDQHEYTHYQQQGGVNATTLDIEGWWVEYMEDPKFRLAVEAQAHRAEYNWFIEHGNRQQRRKALAGIAKRLSGPLYNKMVSQAMAKKLILLSAEINA